MITFWILAAALIVISLALILPVLLKTVGRSSDIDRRQQNIQIAKESLQNLETELQRGSLSEEDYQKAKTEVEMGLHEDVQIEASEITREQKKPALLTALLVAITVPVGSVLLYQHLGNPRAVTIASAPLSGNEQHSMASMIEQLEARLAQDADDVEGWLMLGRSYMTEENYDKADETYGRLLELEPDNAEYMLLKADAMAMKAGGQIRGEPEKLILAALEKDPDNFTGLWLAGMVARENGDNATALKHWNKLKGILPEGSQDLTNLEQLIAQIDGAATPTQQAVPDIDAMVKQLEDKLKTEPQNPTGWFMLGRSYMIMKRFPDAVAALEEAHKLNDQDPETKLSLADALAMTNSGKMAGRPSELVEEALVLTPENPKALWLAGMAAREINMNEKAISYWQKLLPLIASDPQSTEEVKSLILQAGGAVPTGTPSASAANSQDSVTASVRVSDTLASRIQPDDVVFIYAKAFNGSPIPLAAARKQVRDLPIEITLDDSMGMMPQMKMSDHEQWTVGARISKSGQPTASSGDLFFETGPVKSGDQIELLINQIVP